VTGGKDFTIGTLRIITFATEDDVMSKANTQFWDENAVCSCY